jgi:RNA polymerase sigma factor (sigma-70 family)
MDSSPQELELTPDLLEYAKAVALKVARNHCSPRVSYDDVVQEAILRLLSRPPRFDPSRGASEKTLIYTIVQRAVIKYAAREARETHRAVPFSELAEASRESEDHEPPHHRLTENRTTELTRSRWNLDDILQYIDNEESRALCKLFIECNGNASETARRLGVSEGTVRYRLKMLAPKLLAAGFNPFSRGGT